jgi:anti-sigma regulatory factor (Ser/Thr protein kinase)
LIDVASSITVSAIGHVYQLLISILHYLIARCAYRPHNAGVHASIDTNDENHQPAGATADSATATGDDATAHSQSDCREFSFPGDLASVPASREQVMQFVRQHCPDEGDEIDIMVALQEALANAALHGCGDNSEQTIHCIVSADGCDITITVRDPGPGFDVAAADPNNYSATTLTHGRGICLIRSLVTEIAFARGGSEIQLRKGLTAS